MGRLTFHNSRAAGRAKRVLIILKGNMTGVFVVSRTAVNRRFDLPNKPERFRGEMPILHQVTCETDKFRIQIIDRPNHLGCIAQIALVMEIGEMNEAAFSSSVYVQLRHAQGSSFNQNRIDANERGHGQRADAKKFAAGHLRHCFELSKRNTLIDSLPGSSTLQANAMSPGSDRLHFRALGFWTFSPARSEDALTRALFP